jgi:hypothetical protein
MRISLHDPRIAQAILDSKQLRARVRRMSVWEVLVATSTAELEMDILRIPLRYRAGVRYVVAKRTWIRGGTGPYATTEVTLERGARQWYLVGVRRLSVRADPGGTLLLPAAAQQVVLRNATTGLGLKLRNAQVW